MSLQKKKRILNIFEILAESVPLNDVHPLYLFI